MQIPRGARDRRTPAARERQSAGRDPRQREALGGGPLARLRDGDVVSLSAEDGTLSTTADLSAREPAQMREVELAIVLPGPGIILIRMPCIIRSQRPLNSPPAAQPVRRRGSLCRGAPSKTS
jgi:hypothetical protein